MRPLLPMYRNGLLSGFKYSQLQSILHTIVRVTF